MFCEQIGCNPRKEGIFKVNAVNRDNPGGEALQEDYRRQTLENFHNKLLFKTGRRQHTFGILMIFDHHCCKMKQIRSFSKNLDNMALLGYFYSQLNLVPKLFCHAKLNNKCKNNVMLWRWYQTIWQIQRFKNLVIFSGKKHTNIL